MKILRPGDFALISSNVPDSTYPVWDSAASYNSGDIVYVPDNHGEYQAITSNSGLYPPDNPADWQWLGTTNRWRMFDQYLNTATVNNGTISIEVSAYGSEGLFIGNIYGTTLNIDVVDNVSGSTIESETINLMTDPTDWEDYFYGDWIDEYKRSYFYERKTLTGDVTYKLTLDAGADDAKIGIFMVGKVDDIGATLYGVDMSALDYSKVITDANTGATYLEQGNYAKTMQADIFAYTSEVDVLYRKLTDIRGTPCVFVGGKYETLTVYGFVKKFETVLKGPVETMITVDLQGLI